jgi:hypothetical protein
MEYHDVAHQSTRQVSLDTVRNRWRSPTSMPEAITDRYEKKIYRLYIVENPRTVAEKEDSIGV